MLTNSRDIIRRLETEGYRLKSIRGSHHKYVHDTLKRMVIVPHPKKGIPVGTVLSVYRQAGWEKD